YVVAFAVSTLTVFFSLASISILPSLVTKTQLVEANSKLAVSDSVLALAGPGAAGGMIQLVSAPRAIVADAASYVVSALSLRGVGCLCRRLLARGRVLRGPGVAPPRDGARRRPRELPLGRRRAGRAPRGPGGRRSAVHRRGAGHRGHRRRPLGRESDEPAAGH